MSKQASVWQSALFQQLLPIGVCAVLFIVFIASSSFFITNLINPFSSEKISMHLQWVDVSVGFFLYFVTAVDYALIVGRMQLANPGAKPRFVMNVCTCLGCFIGVSLVLFLWGFAKEIDWLIIALLIFAGAVMVKLAYESSDYFRAATSIPAFIRLGTVRIISALHMFTKGLTFWIPELGSPKVKRMSLLKLASWSFLLPFIIGLDDFVGYMGAMTIYNVFSLLVGIFFADVVIDVLIFVSPSFTKKVVQSALLSLLACYAFLYLMYKSFSEAALLALHPATRSFQLMYGVVGFCLVLYLIGVGMHQKSHKKV